MFSQPVQKVSDTSIFARSAKDGRQFLVYSMMLSAREDLAMILPLPVPENSPEDAIRFINLEKYPAFFADMRKGFPEPPTKGVGRTLGLGAPPAKKLEVVEVGSFEASFVPSIADFQRLDARFRLPADVWDKLPGYKDFGFAVFKLKKGAKTIHPMAFEFPRADPRHLFFPTVHVHDGKAHAKAYFDHALYCQLGEGEHPKLLQWKESRQPARMFMKAQLAKGIINAETHCYQKKMRGNLDNRDILV
jgi:hypothetical protein